MANIVRMARIKKGQIVSVTLCDLDNAELYANLRGVDAWHEIPSGTANFRMEKGDKVSYDTKKLVGKKLQSKDVTITAKVAPEATEVLMA